MDELKLEILKLVTESPGLDDMEIADRLGKPTFEIAAILRELAAEGLMVGN